MQNDLCELNLNDFDRIGDEIHALATRLWPINRSITGPGVRETFSILKSHLDALQVEAISTNTQVFDWRIPKEWEVIDAYIVDPDGSKLCDFAENNLHLVGYSVPFEGVLSLADLQSHLYSDEALPNAIPYVTSYYTPRWGFCLTHKQRKQLKEGQYKVVVRTRLFDGVMNYAELKIKGRRSEEIFLSSYICHPSMANNELSGPCVLTYLGKWLQKQECLEYSYRIIFVPETIGAIAYLANNYSELQKKVIAGFNVTCVGDERDYSYLPSRLGDTYSDRVAQHVLTHIAPEHSKYSWLDRGSDERQYCAPGIDLPICSMMRSKYGEYPEYHTSLDNLESVVTPSGLLGGFMMYLRAIQIIENDFNFISTNLGEPQMGRRNLYPTLSKKGSADSVKKLMDILSFCDGTKSVLQIAEILKAPVWHIIKDILVLEKNNLIEKIK